MNFFHCVDDAEHVAQFSIEDVENYIKYINFFNKPKVPHIMEKAYALLDENADNADVHGFLHVALEYEINAIHIGEFDKSIMLSAMYDLSGGHKFYDAYIRAINVTNECGRNKYTPKSEEEVFKLIGKEKL